MTQLNSQQTQELGKDREIPSIEFPRHAKIETPLEHVWAWTNPQNGFRVVQIHMYANPKKQDPKYEAELMKGMSWADFLREHHLVWASFSGRPVYVGDWSKSYHVSAEPVAYAPHLPIVRGWDFGLTPACVITQLWPEMRLIALGEVVAQEDDIEHFAPMVHQRCLELFPQCRTFFDVVDPSGFFRRDTDSRSCVSIMRDLINCNPIPGIQNPVARRNAVVKFLQRNVRGKPAFLADPGAATLIKGFDGGFHYGYGKQGILKEKWEKNIFSHVHEGLQYVATRVLDLPLTSNQEEIKFDEPKYSLSN